MKPEFKVGQVWKYNDGGGFAVKITKVDPMRAMCVNKGDSNWEEGEEGPLFSPSALRIAADVVWNFNDYYQQIYDL